MWKELKDEQDDLLRTTLACESTFDNGMEFPAPEADETGSAARRTTSWAENLELIMVRPGFQLPAQQAGCPDLDL